MDGDDVGDPACWLHLLCPSCGAVVDRRSLAAEAPPRCWRCGEPVGDEAPPGDGEETAPDPR